MSFPRKRESRATATSPALDPAFALRDAHKFALTHGRYAESPLPLWERDRVRGLARQREETSLMSMRENAEGNARRSNFGCARRQRTLRRLPAPDPSPCPSPTVRAGEMGDRCSGTWVTLWGWLFNCIFQSTVAVGPVELWVTRLRYPQPHRPMAMPCGDRWRRCDGRSSAR